jgi:hypothetical protein
MFWASSGRAPLTTPLAEELAVARSIITASRALVTLLGDTEVAWELASAAADLERAVLVAEAELLQFEEGS